MKKGFFITGTDTGVGKTWASVALLHYFNQKGESTLGMKPVAAGCEWLNGELRNEDALLLQKHASVQVDYPKINPYAFKMPVSPHLAAKSNPIKLDVIEAAFNEIKDEADVLIVEGAGGWFAPLDEGVDIADLAKQLELPVIVVVAIRLGCINHARLTFQAIQASGVPCVGWLAMCTDPLMLKQDENIATIKEKASAPLLGVLPYTENMDFVLLADHIYDL